MFYLNNLILPSRKDFTMHNTFIIHAASLRQAFAHCGRFLAAASRRSLGRVSVPMWPFTLSGRLPIVALVGHYPTNKLMGRGLISKWQVLRSPPLIPNTYVFGTTSGINPCFHGLSRSLRQITHVLLTRLPLDNRNSTEVLFQISRSTCMLKTRR